MAPTKVASPNVSTKKSTKMLKAGKSIKRNEFLHKDKTIIKKVGKSVLKEGAKNVPVQKIKKKNQKKIKKKEQNKTDHMDDTEENGVSDVPMTEVFANSIQEAKDAFSWLIAPIPPENFMLGVWEKAPLHIRRPNYPNYYKTLLSTERLDEILRDNHIKFSKNIDITSYKDGERETHNPSGRATPAVVWDFYKKGCSVRMLNPQTFCPELRKLNSTLQDYFGCFVGANSYLTPANTQGFAPHYDDIEAFILQVEGKKHWKVYRPRKIEEELPRFSSENLQQSELGKPVLEVTLEPGDILYFPRGYIHQASTPSDTHSLHITVSCYQRNTWGDFFEKLLPAALAVAQEEDVEFRRGLPLNYLSYMGVCYSDVETEDRANFMMKLKYVFMRLLQHLPVDTTADQMGKQFIQDALPPVLTKEEMKCTVYSSDNMVVQEDKTVKGIASLNKLTKIKLLRASVLRLVKEDEDSDTVNVYHYMDNSLEYHGEESQMFEVSTDDAMAVEFLIKSYPKFVSVEEIPLDRQENRLELANLLWRKGLLLTEEPLK